MATATTTRKKTSRAKKITIDEAEIEQKKAIALALKDQKEKFDQERIQADMDTPDNVEFEDTDPPSFGTNSEGEYYEDIEEPDDIMQYGASLEEEGKDVSYYIKKDGAFVDEVYSHIPMNQLAKKYGGGKYTIAIKDEAGRWIKRKTVRVAGDPVVKQESTQPIIPPQPHMPQIDLNETFKGMTNMFVEMQQMVDREKTRNDRDDRKSNDNFNTVIFQTMSQQAQATQTMMSEMQKNNMEMITKISEAQTRSMEKAEERSREMIREIRASMNKSDDFGLKDALALVESSRNSGMDTMKTVMELSEVMADRAIPESSGETDSKDTLLTKLVSGFIPLLTKANQQAGTMPGVAPQAVQGTLPPQHRGPVPQQNVNVQTQAPQRPPAQNNQRARASQVRTASPQGSPIKGNGVYSESRPPHAGAGQLPHEADVQNITAGGLGLPSFTDKGKINRQQPRAAIIPPGSEVGHTVSSEALVNQDIQNLNSTSEPILNKEGLSADAKKIIDGFKEMMPFVRDSDVYKSANPSQQNIVELALPIIAQYINDDKFGADLVAHFVIDECTGQGFSAKTLSEEFTFDFLVQLASNFGIGENKNAWFGEFYETIKDVAGLTRESALRSPEPTVS